MRTRLILIITLLTHMTYAQNNWIARDSVNGPPRGACASFELNEEAFIVGGIDVEESKRKMYSYDLDQDDWDDEITLGGETGEGLERSSAVGFSGMGCGYIALGSGTATLLKDTWKYDPETESWTQMADFIGSSRMGAIAFVIDDIAFVGTGQDSEGLLADFYKYNLTTNEWSELDNFPGGARKEAVGFTMGGKGYLGTGRGTSSYLADFWEYDPISDDWTRKADFPGTPRLGAVGCGLFPSAFIMLGEDADFEFRKDVWEYNYFGNVWSQRMDYPGGSRTQANAIVVDNRIFVGLGYNGIYHDDFYEYQPLPSAINETNSFEFELYPNPLKNSCRINFSNEIQTINCKLFGLNGSNYSDRLTISNKGLNYCELTLQETLPKGVYLIVLFDGSTPVGSQKITIQ